MQELFHYLNKKRVYRCANVYLSCGEAAAEWLYGGTRCIDKCEIVYNGIDIRQFAYNSEIRLSMRNKLKMQDVTIIGHVGRFSLVKNHDFLIEIFKCIARRDPNAQLILVGDGEQKESIISKVDSYNLSNNVTFLGKRNDVNDLLQVMDVMVFPSYYEGFPVTIIEAEASGLSCLISDGITDEVMLNPNVVKLSLNEPPDKWAEVALQISSNRCTDKDYIKSSGLDIMEVVRKLKKIYGL